MTFPPTVGPAGQVDEQSARAEVGELPAPVDPLVEAEATSTTRSGGGRANFEAAVELNDNFGAVPWGVRSRYQLAAVIEAVDPQRAHLLLTEASTTAGTHGLVAMGRRLDEALTSRTGGGPVRERR